jgi:hypothetical protein
MLLPSVLICKSQGSVVSLKYVGILFYAYLQVKQKYTEELSVAYYLESGTFKDKF